MQPDEQQQPQQAPSQQPQQPSYEQPNSGPIVTLSPEQDQAPQAPGIEPMEPVHWQATEYVHREKDQMWFVIFGIVVIVLIAVAIFVIKSWTFAALIPVMAAALIVYTRRPPRLLDYTLSRQGLYINDQLYPFSEFKSFSLIHGVDQYLITLIPTKRFKPGVSINFPEEVGEAIVDMLAARLPMREMQPDLVDRLIRKLHL